MKQYIIALETVKIILESGKVTGYGGRNFRKDLIQLKLVDDGVEINATDGHILSSVTVEDEELVAMMKDNGHAVGYLGEYERGILNFQFNYHKKKTGTYCVPLEVFYQADQAISFPDIQVLIKESEAEEEGQTSLYFDVELFHRLAGIVGATNSERRHSGVKVTTGKDPGKALALGTYSNAHGVLEAKFMLMPMRPPAGTP